MKEGRGKDEEIDRHRIMPVRLNALVYRVRMQQAKAVTKITSGLQRECAEEWHSNLS